MESSEQELGEVTRLLGAAHAGDPDALQNLLPLVYEELRAVAHGLMSREAGQTMDPTCLVHELWLRLERQDSIGFEHRAQFFGAAARSMRRILVDHARRRSRKRPEEEGQAALDSVVDALESSTGSLVALESALEDLAARDPDKARLVELRFFAGLPMQQIADVMGIPLRRAERDWALVRAWLKRQLEREA